MVVFQIIHCINCSDGCRSNGCRTNGSATYFNGAPSGPVVGHWPIKSCRTTFLFLQCITLPVDLQWQNKFRCGNWMFELGDNNLLQTVYFMYYCIHDWTVLLNIWLITLVCCLVLRENYITHMWRGIYLSRLKLSCSCSL